MSRNKYHKPNHFAVKCHSKKPPTVHPVTGSEDPDEDEKIQMSIAITLDDTQLVTLRLESCSLIRFQVDTGAQCNVVPLGIYKKATKDLSLAHVSPSHTNITGTSFPFVGTVLLWVWWEDFNCSVDCKLVGRQDTCQLLGRNARQGMRTVSYLDNNHLNKPQTGGAPVYTAEELGLLTMQEITKTFSTVFEGVCWSSACAISHSTQ